jgi:uracil phosphoribosyltransferase
VIPETAGDRSRAGRQSFDSLDGHSSFSVSSSSSNTPRSQISSYGDEQVKSRSGLTSSQAAGSTAAAPSEPEERIANPNKNSRYLREMDRREILARIEQGEKQATLAKEYQVSRAAICNLNKHREDVMLRKDENPLAKHPKKPRPKSFKVKVRSSSKAANRKLPSPRLNGNNSSGGKGHNTHEVKSRAAALLLTSLRNKNTTMSEFRRSSERLVRLMLEEALALVPIKAVEVFLSDSVRADGVGWEHPPCAISMESHSDSQQQQTTTEGGSPLLDLFRAIEPDQPTARVSIIDELDHHHSDEDQTGGETKTQEVNLVDTHQLPASLKYHNVFVFDVSATSSDAICAVVQNLQERGAVEAMITVVALFINSEIIASVHKKYPSVKFVAAQIDPSGKTPSAPSVPGSVGNGEEGGVGTTNGETPRPPCCLDFVLTRLRQVYGGSFTTEISSNLIK